MRFSLPFHSQKSVLFFRKSYLSIKYLVPAFKVTFFLSAEKMFPILPSSFEIIQNMNYGGKNFIFATCNFQLHLKCKPFVHSRTSDLKCHTHSLLSFCLAFFREGGKSTMNFIYLVDVLAFSTVDMSLANASVTLLLALEISSFEVVNSYNSGSTPYSIK